MASPGPTSVFINCPFDDEYLDLFRPLVFTVLSLGLQPRFALERSDSGESRLHKIVGLIEQSQFGIHDLSRCKARKKGEFYRMNMPLELGYDLGAKALGGRKFAGKKVLILQEIAYSVQKAASDLAGCDCAVHDNEPAKLVSVVRDWFFQEANGVPNIGAAPIWYAYTDFINWSDEDLRSKKWAEQDIANIGINELKGRMVSWLKRNPY